MVYKFSFDMIRKNNEGQALFEFIIFLPIMLLLYTLSINFYAAINHSINQQKVVRGYLYSSVKSNSFAPTKADLSSYAEDGSTYAGMFAIGWRNNIFSDGEDGSRVPEASCVKIANFSGQNIQDECLDKTGVLESSKYVRIKTVYGLCTTTYQKYLDSNDLFVPGNLSATSGSCSIQSL